MSEEHELSQSEQGICFLHRSAVSVLDIWCVWHVEFLSALLFLPRTQYPSILKLLVLVICQGLQPISSQRESKKRSQQDLWVLKFLKDPPNVPTSPDLSLLINLFRFLIIAIICDCACYLEAHATWHERGSNRLSQAVVENRPCSRM